MLPGCQQLGILVLNLDFLISVPVPSFSALLHHFACFAGSGEDNPHLQFSGIACV